MTPGTIAKETVLATVRFLKAHKGKKITDELLESLHEDLTEYLNEFTDNSLEDEE